MTRYLSDTAFNHIVRSTGFTDMVRTIAMHENASVAKSYEDTELHQAMIVNADSIGFMFDNNDDRPERIIKSFFAAVATFLSKRKIAKADEAVAFVVQDINGIFKFAGYVEYHANEANPDEPGNWSYSTTFREEDLQDLEKRKSVKKFLAGDPAFKQIFDKVSYDVGGFVFERETFMFDACNLIIDSLIQTLDHEAKEGEVVDVEMPGYFTASVGVENGEKVFSITPDGHMKALIKSDIQLDGNN